MPAFLLKTEPSEYAYADLARDRRTTWTGVSNPAARIVLRTIRANDHAFVYHTGDERAIVGIARVVKGAHADPARPGLNDRGEINFPVMDLAPERAAATPLTLAAMKADPRFRNFRLLTHARQSVVPVPDDLAALIRRLIGA